MVDRQFEYVGCFDRGSRDLRADAVPLASAIERNAPLYDMAALAPALEDPARHRDLLDEWAPMMRGVAGVIVLKHAYADAAPIDCASEVFREIIAEAWSGPDAQMTAQVNQIRPGGKAQRAHRDCHLGFQTAESAARYPAHAQEVTATLTLQGAVAHCDMDIDSGPTKLLPFSQLYAPGDLACHEDDHRAWFEDNYVQLPLAKGDVVFFNPALFHTASENLGADSPRMVNLLQVSSAFGRPMEAVDRSAMAKALLPALVALRQSGRLSQAELGAAIAASAEGYPFPTNLDADLPEGGNAPTSLADLMRDAVEQGKSGQPFAAAMAALKTRQAA